MTFACSRWRDGHRAGSPLWRLGRQGARLPFCSEYDNGTETLSRLERKLGGYAKLARAVEHPTECYCGSPSAAGRRPHGRSLPISPHQLATAKISRTGGRRAAVAGGRGWRAAEAAGRSRSRPGAGPCAKPVNTAGIGSKLAVGAVALVVLAAARAGVRISSLLGSGDTAPRAAATAQIRRNRSMVVGPQLAQSLREHLMRMGMPASDVPLLTSVKGDGFRWNGYPARRLRPQ